MSRRRDHLGNWRVLAQDAHGNKVDLRVEGTEFDELVLGTGDAKCWLHLEQMNREKGTASYFLGVGNMAMWINVSKGGQKVEVVHESMGKLEDSR